MPFESVTIIVIIINVVAAMSMVTSFAINKSNLYPLAVVVLPFLSLDFVF